MTKLITNTQTQLRTKT